MKNTFFRFIGTGTLAILTLIAFAQIEAPAQERIETKSAEDYETAAMFRHRSRALEGAWNGQFTVLNCQTGTAITTFATLNTFMRGGTMVHSSASPAPATRGIGQGIWEHEGGRNFTFVLQFFRFNADGTYAGFTKARRLAELNHDRTTYAATVTLEIFNPAGTLVGTGCATETATRF